MRERDEAQIVTQTVDRGMGVEGKTKDGLKEEGRTAEVLVSQAPKYCPTPLALLLFLPFKALRNINEIMSASKEAE